MPHPASASIRPDSRDSGSHPVRLPSPPPSLLAQAVLLIDFDGTLVEIAERPDAVEVDAELRAILTRLATRFPDRLAIVSGRSIEQLDGFFGDLAHRVSVIGSHGVERRAPGEEIVSPAAPPSLPAAERQLRGFAEAHAGMIVETKSLGVALHYRQTPAHETEARAFAEQIGAAHGLQVQHGKMMSELRGGSGDKGSAVRSYMAEPARAGLRPVVLGDDLTDEPAFVAAAYLGGAGVLIGNRTPTAALFALPDVAAARAWLDTPAETGL